MNKTHYESVQFSPSLSAVVAETTLQHPAHRLCFLVLEPLCQLIVADQIVPAADDLSCHFYVCTDPSLSSDVTLLSRCSSVLPSPAQHTK